MQRKNEIVSFNEEVLELSQVLEVEGAELDAVLGGLMASKPPVCPNLTSCTTFTSCTIDVSL